MGIKKEKTNLPWKQLRSRSPVFNGCVFFNIFTDYFLSGGAACECRVTERMTSLFYYRTPVLFPSWKQRAGFYWDTEILNNIRLQHSVASSLSADRSKWSSRPEWVLGDMRPGIFFSFQETERKLSRVKTWLSTSRYSCLPSLSLRPFNPLTFTHFLSWLKKNKLWDWIQKFRWFNFRLERKTILLNQTKD